MRQKILILWQKLIASFRTKILLVSIGPRKLLRGYSALSVSVLIGRDGPVQYEKDDTKLADDDWGLDDFLHEGSKKESSMPSDSRKIGVMAAAGGGAGSSEEYRGRKDRKIGFVEPEAEQQGEMYSAGLNDMGGSKR